MFDVNWLLVSSLSNQPFVKMLINRLVKESGTPSAVGRFVHVHLACFGVFNTDERAIMCPIQFGTQRVPNWELQVKLPHYAQLSNRKSVAKFGVVL
jgi:hypothetical protein